MENPYRLKIRIGEHEFEAEGPVDVVRDQFQVFKEWIAGLPVSTKKGEPEPQVQEVKEGELPHQPLEKIMKNEGRVVSLTARCETVEEAILLILLGQKDFRSNQEVTGAEVMDGLTQSGYRLDRVDRIMDKLSTEGSIITVGMNRGRRYRLSNAGLNKALGVAREVISTVP